MSIDFRLVLCTCPDASSADQLASALVNLHLVACVNILPGLRSIYRWQGRVESQEECLLIIKTHGSCLPALQVELVNLHPYDVPEFIVFNIDDGYGPYFSWLLSAISVSDTFTFTPKS